MAAAGPAPHLWLRPSSCVRPAPCSLGFLANRVAEGQLQAVVSALCDKLLNSSKEQQRDVASLALKTVVAGKKRCLQAGCSNLMLVSPVFPRTICGSGAPQRVAHVSPAHLLVSATIHAEPRSTLLLRPGPMQS